MTDPQQWGWVDDDGSVHVKLPGGDDKVVGQFAAGDKDAALAFFSRKFADAVAEIKLTADRLRQGTASPDQADAVVERMKQTIADPPFVGDIAGLSQLVDALHSAAAERRLTGQAEKARQRAEALAERERIVAAAEELAASTQWKAAGDSFKTLLDEWKQLPRNDKKAEQVLWERFSAARSAFDKARRAHFAALHSTQAEAVEVKKAIIAEAEQLSTSTDWGDTTRAYRALMDRWKAAPRASRDEEDKLWKKFRAAQDVFFDARNQENSSRDADQTHNLRAKEELLSEAEALLPITDLGAAKRALASIAERWEAIGFVPRDAKSRIEGRLRKVEDAVAKAERREWQRTDPAMKERAEQTAAGFRASVAKLEAELAAAHAAGDQRKASKLESSLATTQALLDAAEGALADYS